jgi:acyl-CoA synthetase (AMP-forming)/AMP-acid ligase II
MTERNDEVISMKNESVVNVPEARTLGDLVRLQARKTPDKEALVFEERALSYRGLDERSNRMANALLRNGHGAGSRVAVLDKNSDLLLQILLGCAKAGAVFLSLNWRLSAPEIAYILEDSEAEILFVGSEFHSLVEQIEDQLPALRAVVTMDGPHERWPCHADWLGDADVTDPGSEIGADDVAIQMYTSGTTGHPKGVQLPHRAFFDIWREPAYQEMPFEAPEADSVNLVALPNFHVSGLNWAIRGLREGATNVIMREFEPGATLDAIQRYRIRKLVLVPATIRMLLRHPQAARTDFSSLQFIRYGASPIPLDLLQEAVETFGCGFVQLYGMTETGASGTYLPPEDHEPGGNERMRSAGKAQPGVRVKIVDEQNRPLGPRQTGEVCLASPSNMTGYWKLAEATRATLQEEFVHTGDAGYLDEDGYLYIQDRLKDMIVSGGENVYPAEVENALSDHPDVADVAVIGVPDPRWGEAVKALVVPAANAQASAADLIAHARQRLAAYKLPKTVDFVDELPRNPAGKILKRELRKPYWSGRDRAVN